MSAQFGIDSDYECVDFEEASNALPETINLTGLEKGNSRQQKQRTEPDTGFDNLLGNQAYKQELQHALNEDIREQEADQRDSQGFEMPDMFLDSPKLDFQSPSRRIPDLPNLNQGAQSDSFQYEYETGLGGQQPLAGIVNQTGSLCYYIAVVQGLTRTQALNAVLQLMIDVSTPPPGSFLSVLQETMLRLREARRAISIRKLVAVGPETFQTAVSQQDASECMTLMLNKVQDQLKKSEHSALLSEMLKAELSISMSSELSCFQCSRVHSTTTEEKHMLEVHFERDPQFEWQDEVFYECPDCASSTALLSSRLTHLPQLLIVHMKRYQFQKGSQQGRKLLGQAHMPSELPGYRLVGFICHMGWYQHSGHYVFYWHEDSENERWIKFDDSRVTEMHFGRDEMFWQAFSSSEAPLIAFYRQTYRQ